MIDGDFHHLPVLFDETLEWLQPRRGGVYLDGTLGGAGHARKILEAIGPEGRLLGVDRDPEALEVVRRRLDAPNVTLWQATFEQALSGELPPLDGILLDLGVSSYQLDTARRGFSFMKSGPLDMRMDTTRDTTAADLVNTADERELADIFWRYGEERFSRPIARAIVKRRSSKPFTETLDLAETIARVLPRSKGIHPATRTFQALRIAVNDELGTIERSLPLAIERLKPGGRLVVISFHSLEDRIVKNALRDFARGCICPPRAPLCVCGKKPLAKVLTSKPITANERELALNPRARSAKLRAAERL